MAITTIQSAIEISDVGQLVTSEIVEDEANSVWVRKVEVYSLPNENGQRDLLFTMRLLAAEEINLELLAPSQRF